MSFWLDFLFGIQMLHVTAFLGTAVTAILTTADVVGSASQGLVTSQSYRFCL